MLHQQGLSAAMSATYTDIFICASGLRNLKCWFAGTTCPSREFPAIISPCGSPLDLMRDRSMDVRPLRLVLLDLFVFSTDPLRFPLTPSHAATDRRLPTQLHPPPRKPQ